MTNLMQRGASWLGDKLQTAAGISVTYSRGAGSFTATAIPIENTYEVVDGQGNYTSVISYDFEFVTDEMTFGSGTITPAKADRIQTASMGLFEVMDMPGRQLYERPDHASGGILTIVHTKRVKVT